MTHRARLDTPGVLVVRLAHLSGCQADAVATNRPDDGILIACAVCGVSVAIRLEAAS